MKMLFIGGGCIALLTIGFIVLAVIGTGYFLYKLGVKTEKEDRYYEPTNSENAQNP